MNKRLLSMLLALCMVLTMFPVSATAEDAHTTIGASGEIVAFAHLAETERAVTVGTAMQDLQLPEILTATVLYDSEYEAILVDIPVTWASRLEYDMDVEGEYFFTPVIESCTVSAELPVITLTAAARLPG